MRVKDASVTFRFTGGRASQAHGAALALGDGRGGAVAHVLAHHLLTEHRPRLTNAHSARLRVPDVVVGDDLPVGQAGILVRQNTVRSGYRWCAEQRVPRRADPRPSSAWPRRSAAECVINTNGSTFSFRLLCLLD